MAASVHIRTDRFGVTRLDRACACFVSLSYVVAIFTIFPNWQVYSDNFYYKEAFNYQSDDFFDFYRFFVWRTAGSEPLSVLLFYVSSRIFSFELFIGGLNTIFVYTLTYYLRMNKHSWFIVIFFLITFYYLHVLSIGIHRFKISVCYLSVIAIFFRTRTGLGFLSFLAPFFHGQSIVLLAMASAKAVFSRFKFSFSFFIYILCFLIGSYVVFTYTGVGEKFLSRITLDWTSFAIGWLFAFIFFTVLARPSFTDIILLFMVLILILVLGGFRMNMVLIAYLFWRVSHNIYKFGVLVLITSPYMLSKNIYLYGHYATNLVE